MENVGLLGKGKKVLLCSKFKDFFTELSLFTINMRIVIPQVDHTITMYLVAPNGSFVNYYGQNRTADEIVNSVALNMKKYQKS